MPQLANLVLNDRAATPVAHTFTPQGTEGNSAALVESTGVPIGDRRFVINWSQTSGTGRYKRTGRLVIPVVQTQTINGVSTPVVVRTAYAEWSCTFDSTSTEQERKDCIGMLADSLLATKTVVNDTVVKLEGIF